MCVYVYGIYVGEGPAFVRLSRIPNSKSWVLENLNYIGMNLELKVDFETTFKGYGAKRKKKKTVKN